MIGQVTEIAGRAKQAFIVGQGLSPEGAKLLGKKLACMTIGDLEGLLEMKNIDPFKVIELMGHLKDLAKALVSKSRMNSIDFLKSNQRQVNLHTVIKLCIKYDLFILLLVLWIHHQAFQWLW